MDAHDKELIAKAEKMPWDLINPDLAHSEEAREKLKWIEYVNWRTRYNEDRI